MDLTDRSQRTVRAWLEHVVSDCYAKGRLDVIAELEADRYETRDEGGDVVSMWVRLAGVEERISRIRINPGYPPELLN